MSTYTFSGTDSYSESDVKAVMQNTYEDIIGFANRGIITYERAKNWIEDITYMLKEKVLNSFEIQLYNASGERFQSYKYTVSSNGYLSTGSLSGGINFWSIPKDSSVGLFVDMNYNLANSTSVNSELARRGWGTNGSPLVGKETSERDYISNNLRLQRTLITK
ncbi:hypothetical protein [Pedobacter jeongneungensis]|uniref:HORMA-1 domain-containing protein n=1 Tax=Pedobacter jeongneungensis TaxID=947309 RepID=UPI00046AFE3E|nr:hypothetical protein [Pedobacter jeongneungensis]